MSLYSCFFYLLLFGRPIARTFIRLLRQQSLSCIKVGRSCRWLLSEQHVLPPVNIYYFMGKKVVFRRLLCDLNLVFFLLDWLSYKSRNTSLMHSWRKERWIQGFPNGISANSISVIQKKFREIPL